MALSLLLLAALVNIAASWTNTSMPQLSGGKAVIGYWGSASDKPKESQLAEALKRGYNVISVAFGDTLQADGSFQIHTNIGLPPTKSKISASASVSIDAWQYILSFGGQNAAGPAVTDVDGYVKGFLAAYETVQEKYGFDGIDIDIETNMNTPLLHAFRKIFQKLHAKGQVISMAPQPSNIDPKVVRHFQEGAWNSYVPLVDTTIIDTVTYVAVQLYNNPMPLGTLENYISSLQAGCTIDWDGSKLEVNIPSSKLVFGFPAAPGAGSMLSGEGWELPASSLATHYRSSSTLMATGGCMTWSIGWDASSDWKWVEAVTGIWNAEPVRPKQKTMDSLSGFFLAPRGSTKNPTSFPGETSGGVAVIVKAPPASGPNRYSAQFNQKIVTNQHTICTAKAGGDDCPSQHTTGDPYLQVDSVYGGDGNTEKQSSFTFKPFGLSSTFGDCSAASRTCSEVIASGVDCGSCKMVQTEAVINVPVGATVVFDPPSY